MQYLSIRLYMLQNLTDPPFIKPLLCVLFQAIKPFSRMEHDKQRFHMMDIKQRRPFNSPRPLLRIKQFSPDIDLEVERRKLMYVSHI